MAPATVLTVLLLVSLVFAGHVKSEGQQQEEPPPPVAGGAFPNSDSQCGEARLYRGPCVEILCTVACLVETRQGGHCRGNAITGRCYCFAGF